MERLLLPLKKLKRTGENTFIPVYCKVMGFWCFITLSDSLSLLLSPVSLITNQHISHKNILKSYQESKREIKNSTI